MAKYKLVEVLDLELLKELDETFWRRDFSKSKLIRSFEVKTKRKDKSRSITYIYEYESLALTYNGKDYVGRFMWSGGDIDGIDRFKCSNKWDFKWFLKKEKKKKSG